MPVSRQGALHSQQARLCEQRRLARRSQQVRSSKQTRACVCVERRDARCRIAARLRTRDVEQRAVHCAEAPGELPPVRVDREGFLDEFVGRIRCGLYDLIECGHTGRAVVRIVRIQADFTSVPMAPQGFPSTDVS